MQGWYSYEAAIPGQLSYLGEFEVHPSMKQHILSFMQSPSIKCAARSILRGSRLATARSASIPIASEQLGRLFSQNLSGHRLSSSSSSTRWKSRQGRDSFAREAKVQGLKSRAAFKLLEVGRHEAMSEDYHAKKLQIDQKYRLFKKGQTIVDLVRGHIYST